MIVSQRLDRALGLVLMATMFAMIGVEWLGAPVFVHLAALCVIVFLGFASPQVGWSRRIFVVVGLALLAAAIATRADWLAITEAALRTGAFIAAFFIAITFLRSASNSSLSIETCGRFLAAQPPGRRYAALTVGGHLFGLVLNYGAISLLGGLAEANARTEPNAEIRNHRIRRMLLAIQRGFISTLSWSPLAFSTAISTSIITEASWADAVGVCMVSSVILAGIGWTLDTIFKPRLTTPAPPRAKPPGSWASLLPMLALLALLVVAVGGLHFATGIRAVGIVMLIVPLISLGWIAMQNWRAGPLQTAAKRAAQHMGSLALYRSELVLLVMAGIIGTLGSQLLSPVIAASGLDLAALPGWLLLASMVWVIPLAGFIGMNPILSVSLIAPLLPSAEAMGVAPAAIITALTSGWALSGATSPYTATTLMVGAIGHVSAWRVGVKWNGAYALVCAIVLSAWVATVALIL